METRYNNIATGLAFSPRMEANLVESIRLAEYFNTQLILIHVGDKSPAKEEQLKTLLEKHPFPEDRLKVVWHSGDPVEVILRACKVHKVDLLVAGAVANEGLLTYYMGSVARKLCRQATCSLLLLLEPAIKQKKFHSMVVAGNAHPQLESLFDEALYFAKGIGVEQMTVVEELPPKTIKMQVEDEASAQQASLLQYGLNQRQQEQLLSFFEGKNLDGLQVKTQCIFGKKGYTIGHFAQSTHVDLLVIPGPEKRYGIWDRLFTNNLEYILSDMPTNLLILNR